MDSAHVSAVRWDEVREQVSRSNPKLADVLTDVNERLKGSGRRKTPQATVPILYRIAYSYGQSIVDERGFVPPCGRGSNCPSCNELETAASYSYIPLTLVLRNSAEAYLQLGEKDNVDSFRLIPLRLLRGGELFGVFETADVLSEAPTGTEPSPWRVAAGARSALVLAPAGSKRLAKDVVRLLQRHGEQQDVDELKRELRRDPGALLSLFAFVAAPTWRTEVLVFPKEWFTPSQTNSHADSHRAFILYVYETAWRQSKYLRDRALTEAGELDTYARHVHRDLAANHEADATVMHLVRIARGDVPGFTPTLSEDAGPFAAIQNMLVQGSDPLFAPPGAFPFILQPVHLFDSGSVAYYSLMIPTIPGPVAKPKNSYVTMVEDIRSRVRRLSDGAGELLAPLSVRYTEYFGDVKPNTALNVMLFDDFVARHMAKDFAAQLSTASLASWKPDLGAMLSHKNALNAFIRLVRE